MPDRPVVFANPRRVSAFMAATSIIIGRLHLAGGGLPGIIDHSATPWGFIVGGILATVSTIWPWHRPINYLSGALIFGAGMTRGASLAWGAHVGELAWNPTVQLGVAVYVTLAGYSALSTSILTVRRGEYRVPPRSAG